MLKRIFKILIASIIILIMAVAIALFANFIVEVTPVFSIVFTLVMVIYFGYMLTEDYWGDWYGRCHLFVGCGCNFYSNCFNN